MVLGWAFLMTGCHREPAATGPLEHDAYVWQRKWSASVTDSLDEHADSFRTIVALVGEVGWREGRPELSRVPVNYRALAESRRSVGLALRIGTFTGPFHANDAITRFLKAAVTEALDACRAEGASPAELQLDFDCPESRLGGYRIWAGALREAIHPVPLVITALPSWLGRREFGSLVSAVDGFVLQVHSLQRPRHPTDAVPLCDPVRTRRWVAQAGKLGKPFRVALPTYGYLLAFDRDGGFLGASAEGYPPTRPEGAQIMELSADPAAMAQLVADWTSARPADLTGIIWYRLPVEGDQLNWRWSTLESVMKGKVPIPRMEPMLTSGEGTGGLLREVRLANAGDANYAGPAAIRLRWAAQGRGRLVGHDAVRGFSAGLDAPSEILFTNSICRLPAGETVTIGWVRFDAEVSLECHSDVPVPSQPVFRPEP